MMTFEDKVRRTIETYSMIDGSKRNTVIVGFSGGADSVSLLTVLYSLKEEYSLDIVAAHVNHGLRGAEAKRDEDFAVNYCKKLGVPCEVLHADVPGLAKERGLSFEACGREIRYEFFKSLSLAKDSGSIIATAHNGQDVVETMLFNMSRGSSLHGLCSIPPVRYTDDGLIRIIRPLIESTREEIEEYLREKGADFVNDSTNLDDMYARNNIRLNVLPLLESVNGGAIRNILRLSDSLREDDRYLEAAAKELKERAEFVNEDGSRSYDAETLIDAPYALLSRVISSVLKEACGVQPEKKHIDDTVSILASGGKMQVPKDMSAVVKDGILKIKKNGTLQQGTIKNFKTRNMDIDEFLKSDKLLLENALDYDKILGIPIFRTRHAGDRFSPPFRNLSKSLKSLFNEAHIPVENRCALGILECGNEIIWIEGIGPASGYSVTKNTKEVLYIYVQ